MSQVLPHPNEALENRCAQVIYKLLEEVKSTKAVLYLLNPESGGFLRLAHYGWARTAPPPEFLPKNDLLLIRAQREKRAFIVDHSEPAPEIEIFQHGPGPRNFLVAPIYNKGEWVGLLVQRDRIRNAPYDLSRDEGPTLTVIHEIVEAIQTFTPNWNRFDLPGDKTLGGDTASDIPTNPDIRQTLPGLPLDEFKIPQTPPLDPESEALFGFLFAQPATDVGEAVASMPWDAVDVDPSPWTMGPKEAVESSQDQTFRPAVLMPEQRAYFWRLAELILQNTPASAVALWAEEPYQLKPVLAYSERPLNSELKQQLLALITFHISKINEQELRLITKVANPEGEPIAGAFVNYMPVNLDRFGRTNDMMMVLRLGNQAFSAEESRRLELFGYVLGAHLSESRLHQRYHHAYLSVAYRILKSGEDRIPRIRSHSFNTAKLARKLCLRLGLTSEEVEAISLAAVLHDVGSFMLDPMLMAKPSFDPHDVEQVKAHPTLADEILRDIRFPFDIRTLIRHHHERWDGLGYPDGLSEEAIPLGSRIISVVESFEVMTGPQSYKRAMTVHQAVTELERGRGKQFDPDIVNAMVALVLKPTKASPSE